ncbi:MAG TPA: acyl-CoA dehydrogenase family protein [Chloroflexota bacterium]|nr:acyl-CoA dehydrogenase family protein [Chloroflexota bacterium]
MDFSFTPEQEQFRQEVRAFCRAAVADEQMRSLIGVGHEDHDPTLYHRIAERGWIGMQWPREYGGQERSRVDMCIFYEEMNYARARIGRYTGSVVFVGESIVTYGTAQQKAEFLPRIARGELTCCWGLTEPGSGSDAAALQMRAVDKGDHFVVTGQKVFTSGAHLADMGMFAVRTDPSAPKYHGISLLLIDMNSPGISLRPLHTLGGWRVNETYLDEVVVPKERLMGQQNEGWKHVLTTLGFERSGIASVGAVMRTADDLAAYMAEREAAGQPVAQAHKDRFADLVAQLHAARWMGYRVAWMQDQALPDLARSSMVKVLASDLQLHMANLVVDVLGLDGLVQGPEAPLDGLAEQLYRAALFHHLGGGTMEMQLNAIALQGLGLPRGA